MQTPLLSLNKLKITKDNKHWEGFGEKGNSCTLMVEIQISTAICIACSFSLKGEEKEGEDITFSYKDATWTLCATLLLILYKLNQSCVALYRQRENQEM